MFVFLIYSILSLAEFVLCPLIMKQYKVHFENYSHEPILGQREDRLEKTLFTGLLWAAPNLPKVDKLSPNKTFVKSRTG